MRFAYLRQQRYFSVIPRFAIAAFGSQLVNQEVFNIIGKDFIAYSSKSGDRNTPHKITQFIRKFQLNKALELVGSYSYKLFLNSSSSPLEFIKDVPISESVLAYIAMKLIEESNDYRSKIMNRNDLVDVCDMYFGLPDPDDGVKQCFTRFGMSHFDFDREKWNSLPRTLAIYRDLWSTHHFKQ